MAQIYISYNPYRMETEIKVNGKTISNDSTLYKVVKGKRLQEWIGNFPKMLVDELNTVSFDIHYYGMPLDKDDFEDAFKYALKSGIIKNFNLRFIEGKSDEDISDKIVKVFEDLREGPVDDFRDPKLIKAFENIKNSVFPINVIATMSSGKSTLINALLGKKLMPSKNEACTATITEILDNDAEVFEAVVYDQENKVLREVSELTYDIMNELNDDSDVYKIVAEGNIPFLDAKDTALMLVDTPGPNNSQNQAHKNTTYHAINNDSNNLILYVLNGTQLSTNDDASLLSYVAEQIKKGGKQVRDRFLFVINKMDGFNPEEENVGEVIKKAKAYLAHYGIEDPQIFPCSAFTALNIKTYLRGIDIENLKRNEEKKLPSAARDTLPMIDKFNEHESMHLEQYSTLSPSAQEKLECKLRQAEKTKDIQEQALIHCGIYSIEAAIAAYVKKYAKTKKVKDLVESFQEVLESTQVLAKAKTKAATDEEAARLCAERAAAVKAKIDDGKEAEEFKKKIAELDPMESITTKVRKLTEEEIANTMRVFQSYDGMIDNKSEAERLVSQFAMISSDSIAKLTSELESIINQEIVETGEQLLMEYQKKLTKFDEDATDKQLDFDTVDLIKGALHNMEETIIAWCSEDFAVETVDEIGEVSYEERVYYEKVGQEEEQVFDGTEQVKVGSHQEKIGTRKIKNPDKKGFLGFMQFWKNKYIEEVVYKTVDDYKTVVKYKTVMKDIYEEHIEQVEKFSVKASDLHVKLISELRQNLEDGIMETLSYAKCQIERMKIQFTEIFDELDKLIQQKYTELEQYTNDQKTKEVELEKSKKLLAWIEMCQTEINQILNI